MSLTFVFLAGACIGLTIWGEGGAGMRSGESALAGSTLDSASRSSFLSFNTFLPNASSLTKTQLLQRVLTLRHRRAGDCPTKV
jgi:hypothetical protein